jgi:hypothetical protein
LIIAAIGRNASTQNGTPIVERGITEQISEKRIDNAITPYIGQIRELNSGTNDKNQS